MTGNKNLQFLNFSNKDFLTFFYCIYTNYINLRETKKKTSNEAIIFFFFI